MPSSRSRRILELQAHRPDGLDDGARSARGGRPARRRLAVGARVPFVGRRAADRRPRLRRGLAGPGARRRAARRRTCALVESAIRHCRYLERAVEVVRAGERRRSSTRAPRTWPRAIGVHDLVTARALAALPVILEYAAPLLAEGGSRRGVEGRGVRRGGRAAGARPPRRSWASSRAEVPSPSTPFPRRARPHAAPFCKIAPTPDAVPAAARDGGPKRPLVHVLDVSAAPSRD